MAISCSRETDEAAGYKWNILGNLARLITFSRNRCHHDSQIIWENTQIYGHVSLETETHFQHVSG